MNSKLKIVLIIGSVIGILAFAYIYRRDSGYEVVHESSVEEIEKGNSTQNKEAAQSEVVKKPVHRTASPGLKSSTGEDKVLSDEELEELDRYFDQVEKDWDTTMESFFLKEMAMPPEEFKEYKKLREAYDMDRLEAYQEFHEYMLEKYGEKYTYSPSDDMEKFENKVREQYLDVLRKRIGDDTYKKYLDTLDQFNEKLRREQDPYKGVMVIDF